MIATSPMMNDDVARAQLDLLMMNTRRMYSLMSTFFLLHPTLCICNSAQQVVLNRHLPSNGS